MVVVSEGGEEPAAAGGCRTCCPDAFAPDDLGETRAVGSGDGAGAATDIHEGRP